MIPGELDISSNSSSFTLKETVSGFSNEATQNIFAATEKHRSCPHLMSSVTAGSAMQYSRNVSIFISHASLLEGPEHRHQPDNYRKHGDRQDRAHFHEVQKTVTSRCVNQNTRGFKWSQERTRCRIGNSDCKRSRIQSQ